MPQGKMWAALHDDTDDLDCDAKGIKTCISVRVNVVKASSPAYQYYSFCSTLQHPYSDEQVSPSAGAMQQIASLDGGRTQCFVW